MNLVLLFCTKFRHCSQANYSAPIRNDVPNFPLMQQEYVPNKFGIKSKALYELIDSTHDFSFT